MFATLGVASLLASSQAFSPMGKARMSAKLSMATVVAPAATETQLATVHFFSYCTTTITTKYAYMKQYSSLILCNYLQFIPKIFFPKLE